MVLDRSEYAFIQSEQDYLFTLVTVTQCKS